MTMNITGSALPPSPPTNRDQGTDRSRVGPLLPALVTSTNRYFTAPQLLDLELGRTEFIVDGLLPEGTAVLAAPAKLGKSTTCLHLAIAVARGESFLGQATANGDVLYLAIEDGLRRVRQRLQDLLEHRPPPANLSLATDWTGLGGIEHWVQDHPQARLVIIDTLASTGLAAWRSYAEGYAVMTSLSRLAATYSIALLIVHHVRKSGSRHPLDRVLGSSGLTGAVDTVLVMEPTSDGHAVLHVQGRDVAADEILLDPRTGQCITFDLSDHERLGHREVDDQLGSARQPSTRPMKLEIAIHVLRSSLAEGPRLQQDLVAEAAQLGIGQRSLESAKQLLGAEAFYRGAPPGQRGRGPSWWRLPGPPTDRGHWSATEWPATDDISAAADHSTAENADAASQTVPGAGTS